MKPLALFFLLALAGCDRTHFKASYGRNVRDALKTQVIDPQAGERETGPPRGLDPQEAAIVLDTYRKSLSPTRETQAASRAPVLIVPPGPPPASPGEYR